VRGSTTSPVAQVTNAKLYGVKGRVVLAEPVNREHAITVGLDKLEGGTSQRAQSTVRGEALGAQAAVVPTCE
jgi:hypothetical protein